MPPSFMQKRKLDQGDGGEGPNKKKMSFAERQMLKMGWSGAGLGREGTGIAEPIQVQVRPSGVGIGAVKEKTAQQLREERRRAEENGEEYIDSSEEERRSRKRKAALKRSVGIASGNNTPGGSRTKLKFTMEDVPEGMTVPLNLQEIMDATGRETKLLTSATLSLGANIPEMTPARKIAERARRDLQAFSEAHYELNREEELLSDQEHALMQELENVEREIVATRQLSIDADELRQLQTFEEVIAKIEQMRLHEHEIDPSTAVSAIHPHFCRLTRTWDPLTDDLHVVVEGLRKISLSSAISKDPDLSGLQRPVKRSTPLETMLYTCLLPKLRSALVAWDPYQDRLGPVPVLAAWLPVVPAFIHNTLVSQVIAKLLAAAEAWVPRKAGRKHPSQLADMITPFMPLIPQDRTDSRELFTTLRRKFRALLDAWDMTRPVPNRIKQWRVVLGADYQLTLINTLLPRISSLLRIDFEINPADQDLSVFNDVKTYFHLFSVTVLAGLFKSVILPKIRSILHLWLTNNPNYTELSDWLRWIRKDIFTEELIAVPTIAKEWQDLYAYIDRALDMGAERVKTDLLPPPIDGEESHIEYPPLSKNTSTEPPPAKKEVEETTFRDIAEAWCGEENLLFIPLREAHDTTGSPLFRITASATGKGGVLCYLRGDVLYVMNKKDKSWEHMGLDERLVQRVEGK
jgi:tuftelin-interacting protein 11